MRARNIKPGFFKNEALGEIDPLARLLFIGLWCMADKEGRLEDRPKRIKAEILPYDSSNIEKLLEQLCTARFIVRYEDPKTGGRFIQIPNFVKHQNPHKNERPSEIPCVTECREITGAVREKHRTARADSLIPDSLIPDSTAAADQQAVVVDPEGEAPCPGQDHQQQQQNSNAENVLRKACAERKTKILQLLPHVAPVYDIEAEKFVLHFLGKPPRADPHVELVKWMQRVRKDPPANEAEKPRRPYVTAEELEVFEKTRRRYEQHLCGN